MDDMSETTPGTEATPAQAVRAHVPSSAMPEAYRGGDPTASDPIALAADPDARPGLEPVTVGTGPLTIDDVVRVARDGAPVRAGRRSRSPRCAAPAR